MINWLESQLAGSWQDRWLGSGAEDQADWRTLVTAWTARRTGAAAAAAGRPPPHIGRGLLVLSCADVIRPSAGWLLRGWRSSRAPKP